MLSSSMPLAISVESLCVVVVDFIHFLAVFRLIGFFEVNRTADFTMFKRSFYTTRTNGGQIPSFLSTISALAPCLSLLRVIYIRSLHWC